MPTIREADAEELIRRLEALEEELDQLKTFMITIGIVRPDLEPDPEMLEKLMRRFDEMELSVRSQNNLQNARIEFVWELCERTAEELLKSKLFGKKALKELREVLGDLGLSFGMVFRRSVRSKLKQS